MVFSLTTLLTSSCGGDSDKESDSLAIEYAPVAIERLDKVVESYIDLDSAARMKALNEHSASLERFRQIVSPEVDTVDNLTMKVWSTWPATTAFMPQVNKIYQDVSTEQNAIGEIMARAEKNGLELLYKRFVTVTWGIDKSIILNDSTVFIALNHYLGPLNEAYNGWPEYRRRLKTRDMIPVDVTEAMVGTAYQVESPENENVLTMLVREGAVAVAKERLNPTRPLEAVLGFTPEQLKDIQANESLIWKRLVGGNMLYSTDAAVKSELFDPRPATTMISPDAPGRAVRYIGYRIVSEYLKKKPDKNLSNILSSGFISKSDEVLKKSAYNPK